MSMQVLTTTPPSTSPQVDNLSNLSHNELMCTHWLWEQVRRPPTRLSDHLSDHFSDRLSPASLPASLSASLRASLTASLSLPLCGHCVAQAAAERVLIFQTDSLICREGVEAFAAYDYIGAPWSMDDLWCVGKPWLTQVGVRLIAPDGP